MGFDALQTVSELSSAIGHRTGALKLPGVWQNPTCWNWEQKYSWHQKDLGSLSSCAICSLGDLEQVT